MFQSNQEGESLNIKQIASDKLPHHVAIIMDGNGRWAKKRLQPRVFGHKKGVERAQEIIQYCSKLKIKKLSLYAFSEENWTRPIDEVSTLMSLLNFYLENEFKKLKENNIRLNVIGNLERLPKSTRKRIDHAVKGLCENDGLVLTLALSYGSQSEILDAAKKIAKEVSEGLIDPENIDKEAFESRLQSSELGPVDLLIRTSGEQRISNFMLWQLAYAELYFSNYFWPDFTSKHFDEALIEFSKRQRRFGGVENTAPTFEKSEELGKRLLYSSP